MKSRRRATLALTAAVMIAAGCNGATTPPAPNAAIPAATATAQALLDAVGEAAGVDL